MSTEAEMRFFAEAAHVLRRNGFEVKQFATGPLFVSLNGQLLCEVDRIGGILSRNVPIKFTEAEQHRGRVFDIISDVTDYMEQLERVSPPRPRGTTEEYRILSDYNTVVLAAQETKEGLRFSTWRRCYEKNDLYDGKFFEENYSAAKRDFALRSALVYREPTFSDEQLTEMYRCVQESLKNNQSMTLGQKDLLTNALSQIEETVPDLSERVKQSIQNELAANAPSHQGMTMKLK